MHPYESPFLKKSMDKSDRMFLSRKIAPKVFVLGLRWPISRRNSRVCPSFAKDIFRISLAKDLDLGDFHFIFLAFGRRLFQEAGYFNGCACVAAMRIAEKRTPRRV